MKNRIQLLLLVITLLFFPLISLAANEAQTFPQKIPPQTTSSQVNGVVVPESVAEPERPSWLTGFNKGAIQQTTEDKSVAAGGGRLLLGLMTVIGLIFGLDFMVKKMGYPGIARGNRIKIMNVLAVGNKEKIMLVKVYGKYLLLGVTAHSINQLSELDPDEVDCEIEESRATQKPVDFPHWLTLLKANLLKIKTPNRSADHFIQGKDATANNGKKFSDYVKSVSQSSSENT